MTSTPLLLTLFLFTATLLSAADSDCAPLSHLPNFNPGPEGTPAHRDYDFHDFPKANGEVQRIKGRACTARFVLKPGTTEPPPSEIVAYYKQEMSRLGANILVADSCRIIATIAKGGKSTWLHAQCDGGWGSVYDVTVIEQGALTPTLTAPAAGDLKWLGHMPGYTVVVDEKSDDAEVEFPISPDLPAIKSQGKQQRLGYRATARPQPASDLETIDNYAAAIRAHGWEVIYQSDKDVTARFEDAGIQTWIRVNSLFGEIIIATIQEKPVEAAAKPQPDSLKSSLDKDGHVALYVNFDFAKATLKPDSAPVIAQVVGLLKSNPGYKLTVEGHTDNIGAAEPNQKLSEARAASVAAAIVKGGVEASRLKSSGAGLSKPIAPNETSEGRAKNRRVELVK